MHPQYIRAPSKNLAPHLWRLHRLKKSTKGGGARRGREEGRGQRWTPDQEGPRDRRVSLLRPDPRPRLGSSVSRSSRNSGGAEAGRGSAAPRRAPFWQELFLQRQREGDTGTRERRAHRLQPSPPPRPRPRPPRPPGALEADALNASRCGAAAAARGDRAHDAGRTARTEPLVEHKLGPRPRRRPALLPT